MANYNTSFSYNVARAVGVISEGKGWNKELNLIEWNGRLPVYDIRSWTDDHEKMGKGISLTREELEVLYELIGKELHRDKG
ncbi:MAG: YdbC family protein [Phascolarctobacterium sp.]